MSGPSPGDGARANPLLLHSLGGLGLEIGGRPIGGAGAHPARLALLSFIALSGPRGVSRDRLHAMFWPDSDSERARGALNQALYALRRDTGEPDLIQGTTTLRTDPSVLISDAVRFEQAADAGAFEEAAQLYAGPFLDGVHLDSVPELERWIEAQRVRLAHRYAAVLERLARDAAGRGDHPTAAGWWQQLAAADPLNSKVAQALVQALAAAGDRAGALLHASRHETRLREELDLRPDREFLAAVAALRTGPRQAPAARAPGAQSDEVTPPAHGPAVPDTPPAPADSTTASESPAHTSRPSFRVRWPLLAGAGLVAIITVAVLLGMRDGPSVEPVGRATQVTFEAGLEIEPALSPDGSIIAYAAGPFGQMRIHVRQPGGRPVPVTPDSGPSQRRPLWSPDGTRLLLLLNDAAEDGSNSGLAVMPALGGVPRVLIPSGVASAAWAPDGRRIAYVRGDTLYVVPIEGSPPRALAGYLDLHGLAWSPDGRWIAAVAGNSLYDTWGLGNFGNIGPSEILVIPAEGGRPVPVTSNSALNMSPAWSPDSRRLLFVSNRDGPRDVYAVTLDRSGLPTGAPTRLTTGLMAHSISRSGNGRRLAYSVFTQQANLWSVPIRAGRVASVDSAAAVTTGNQMIEAVTISADGRRLYFDSDRAGNLDLYRLDLPGGEPVRLTFDPSDDFAPSESPDGQWVAFHSRRYGSRDIMVMPSAGGEAQRVTTDPGEERWPRWSPDGGSLVYSQLNTTDRNGVYVVRRGSPVAGRRSTARSAASGEPMTWGAPRRLPTALGYPDWLADGRSVVHATPGGGISIAPVAGGPGRLLYAPRSGTDDPVAAGFPRMAPDEKAVLFKSVDPDGSTRFWRVALEGGAPEMLAQITDPLRPTRGFAYGAGRLYFPSQDQRSDIFVAELGR